MGPKYEFTGETKKHYDHTLHRIRRLSDGKIGGWIESEDNLSQDGNCWVDGEAMVYDYAIVSGNAQIYDHARVDHYSKVYGNAKIYDYAYVDHHTNVYDNAQIYGNAVIFEYVEVYGDAEVYGHAKIYWRVQVYGNARVCGTSKISDHMKIDSGKYTHIKFAYDENLSNNSETDEVVQDFIYKVNDSNKLTTQTEYDSVDEFFSEPITNDIKLDTLVICAVDTKEPLIKLQKVEAEDKTEFKFIVDITNEDNDDFRFRSIIKSQEQLDQLVQQTIEALKQYPKFSKYANDLEEYL